MNRLFGCFVLMCCWISFSQAHEVRPAFLKVTETNLETDRSEFEISFRQPQINGRFLGLSVSTNCDATELSASLTVGALTEVFELECGEESLQYIEVDGLDRTLIDTLVSIRRLDGSINEILINGNEPRLDLTVATPTVPVYLIIGIEHLLLGFDHILPLEFDAALIRDENISWISINSSKPGRNEEYCLLVHSTNNWADEHIDDDRESVMDYLCQHTSEVIGHDVSTANHRAIHGWRYANIEKQEGETHFIESNERVGVCGDWLIQGRVEAAFTSGFELTNKIFGELPL